MSRFRSCRVYGILCLTLVLCGVAPRTHAALAVVDVKAIIQLVEQLRVLEAQLQQAQQQFQSMTGPRGMERLLAQTVRNYLPPDWQELERVLRGASATFSSLATSVRNLIEINAILARERLGYLAPEVREAVEAERRALALHQAVTRSALANSSHRFQAIQQLINAIPTAPDQKAILELQARIQAEQAMLQNEHIKLQILQQNAQAEEAVRRQREWELAVEGRGRFATRFRPQP